MPRLRKGFRSRRGRPATNRPSIDRGTPELAVKRSRGETSEVIDKLLEQAHITEAQHWCALHFRWLYCLRYGSPTVQCMDFDRQPSCSTSTEDEEWRQNRSMEYLHAAEALKKQSLLSITLRVAVFNDPAALRAASGSEIHRALCDALHLLMQLWNKKSVSTSLSRLNAASQQRIPCEPSHQNL